MIHCLSFWSVFGTTCGNLFRSMTNYHSVWKSIDLMQVANACMYLFVSSSFGGGRNLRCTLLSLSWKLFVPREYYIRRLCGRKFAVLLYRDTWGRLLAEIYVDKLWFFHAQWWVLWIRVLSGFLFFNLCSRFGKKDRYTAPFAALFHCSCHCSSPFLLISLATDVVSVVCCQVQVSAMRWSRVQRSPTDCDASLCVI